MLSSILILITANPSSAAYNYQAPNILIAAPVLNEATYSPVPLLILNVSSGGTEIVIHPAARNPNTKSGNL